MPTINKRFLAQLLLVLVALGGLLAAVHTVQASRIPDALRRQADRAAEADKPDAAVRYLRQYLEFRPDDMDVQAQLAEKLAARANGNRNELAFLYDKILRADPDRESVRRSALDLCLKLNPPRFTDAEIHAEALLKTTPADADLLQKLAAAQAGLRKTEAARKSYEAAVAAAPADLLAHQRLAQFVWKDLDNPADARKAIDRMVAALPDKGEAYLTRAKFAIYSGDAAPPTAAADPVLADLKKARELAPTNPEVALLTAERLQRHRDLTAARQVLTDALAAQPGEVKLVRALAWLEVNRGNPSGAVVVLEDAIPHAKDPLDLLVPLADLLLQSGDVAKAEEVVRKLAQRRGAGAKLQANYLRARVAMRQQKWDDAVGVLADLRSAAVELPGLEAQANLLLASCYQKKADTEKEIETLRLVTSKDPAHLPARVSLAVAYLNAGRPADALAEYDAAAESPFATAPVLSMLVRLKAHTASPADWPAVQKRLTELAPRFGPNASEPALLAADVVTLAGKPAQAVAGMKGEVARRPGDPKLWARLAMATADVEGVAAGLKVIDEAIGTAGDGADLRIARAELYLRDPARLRPIPSLEAETHGWSEADQTRFLYGLTDVYDRAGDKANLVRLSRRIAAKRPTEPSVWLSLAERAAAAGDDAALAEAKSVLAKLEGPDGPGGVLVRAWAGGPDVKAALVAKFGATPDRADACVALARVSPDQAHALLTRAVALEPTRYEPATAFVAHLAAAGADADLTRYLARLATDPRWAGEPFRRVVRAATLADKTHAMKLLGVARRFIERTPGGNGWLADTYHAAGRTTEALAYAEQAAKGGHADDYVRLAVRKPDAATAAKAALSPKAFAAFAAAFAHTPNGKELAADTPAAKRMFAEAFLALRQARGERTEAIGGLEAFLKVSDLPPADSAWASRTLAMLLAVRGETADRKRAVELLATATDTAGLSTDDRRAFAGLLASLERYLDGPDRVGVLAKAVAVQETVAKATNTPRDQFLLAQMHRAAGNPQAAVAGLNALLAKDSGNVEYLLAALGVLVGAEQYPAAAAFAERLMKVAPADFRVVSAVARYEARAGRPETALAVADGYARSADPASGELFVKSMRSADLLADLARLPNVAVTDAGRKLTDAAIGRYDSLLPGRAEAVVSMAAALAADRRGADAFARIEKHGRTASARVKATAGVTVLRAAGGGEPQFARVGEWLAAAKAEEPESSAVRLAEAEYHAVRKEFPQAQAAYEAVLKSDPRNVTALNNLAWLLSADPRTAAKAVELIDRAAAETGLTGELLDTRGRARLALRQPTMAESDAAAALRKDKTPLRYFHLALALNEQRPAKADDAKQAFQKAKAGGLDENQIHPTDRAAYRALANNAQ